MALVCITGPVGNGVGVSGGCPRPVYHCEVLYLKFFQPTCDLPLWFFERHESLEREVVSSYGEAQAPQVVLDVFNGLL